jgi:HEPN domain-containing protein
VGSPKNIDARKYARVAKQRFDEAMTVLKKAQLPAAAQYLGGYAVECILKALVLTLTPATERPNSGHDTIEWLKTKFGHDLRGLRAEAARHGVRMSAETVAEFGFVLSWDPQSRYELGPGDPETAERFLAAAEKIIKWADERM